MGPISGQRSRSDGAGELEGTSDRRRHPCGRRLPGGGTAQPGFFGPCAPARTAWKGSARVGGAIGSWRLPSSGLRGELHGAGGTRLAAPPRRGECALQGPLVAGRGIRSDPPSPVASERRGVTWYICSCPAQPAVPHSAATIAIAVLDPFPPSDPSTVLLRHPLLLSHRPPSFSSSPCSLA